MSDDDESYQASEPETDSLDELQEGRGSAITVDEPDEEIYELPSPEIADELTIVVVPQQADEFRCERCFLVRHRSQRSDGDVCRDCE